MNKKNIIHVVGIGPGRSDMMTRQAETALMESDVIVGYPVYLSLLDERYADKKMLSTPMTKETERCRLAYDYAVKGQRVSLICSGDAGIYGLASLMYELLPEYPSCDLDVIPGITAALSGAALVGAPLCNDFCVVSLSDYLTSKEQIKKRLLAAASTDFCIAIYNPASKRRTGYLKWACETLLDVIEGERVCAIAMNIGRDGESVKMCSLCELRAMEVDMFSTVFVGSSDTIVIDGRIVTKRGYQL